MDFKHKIKLNYKHKINKIKIYNKIFNNYRFNKIHKLKFKTNKINKNYKINKS